jgi:D-3-phosphoglycerate dehydrogenase
MHILFADKLDESLLAPLTDAGHTFTVDGSISADDLPGRIAGADVVVVRSTKVTADAFAAADNLGMVVRAGAGTDNIDKEAASTNGVYVCNVPGRNAIAVAELTLGLMLAIDRHIADQTADLRNDAWNKSRYTKADGIAGKTIAIVGLGEIGLAVAERAKAFGMSVTAVRKDNRSDKALSRIRSIGIRLVEDQAELLAGADVVSIHVPKNAGTIRMVNTEFLAQLRYGAIVLNTSRGEIVDEAALIKAMDTRGIRAGLDVFNNEPSGGKSEFVSDLAKHSSVVGTHHVGASTNQSQTSVAEGTVEVIDAYTKGNVVNCVNMNAEPTGNACLVVRHADKVGVLAQIFAILRSEGINVQQVENQVFSGAQAAAVASIQVSQCPAADTLVKLSEVEEVIAVSAITGS